MTSGALALAQVRVSSTLRDVILALDRSALGIALVTDDAMHLQGIFTDGDVRRALIRGAALEADVATYMIREFTSVGPNAGRAEVLDLMQARRFDVVPIVDAQGRLCGCHRIHDLLGVSPRPNWAIIMAGGRGTRLGALTQDLPKPMIRIAGRPILERLVLHLVGFGIRRIFLSVNYLAHVIEDHFGNGQRFGCAIEYLREERPLGTGGALSLLPTRPTDPILVVNGDLVTQANVGAMLDAHADPEQGETMITLATRRYFHAVPFGCIDVEGTRIVGMEEKPTLSRLINAGMYVISPKALDHVPQDAEFSMPALLADCLARNERVQSFEVADDWIDVGQKDQLKEARGEDR